MNKMIINLFGGPGSGKTTQSSLIFSKLKRESKNVGLLTEMATTNILEKNFNILNYQYYLTTQQLYYQEIFEENFEIVITDSPILLGLIYDKNPNENFKKFILKKFNSKENLNFFIERNLDNFSDIGRIHNLEESIDYDKKILNFLNENNINYHKIFNKHFEKFFETFLKKINI